MCQVTTDPSAAQVTSDCRAGANATPWIAAPAESTAEHREQLQSRAPTRA